MKQSSTLEESEMHSIKCLNRAYIDSSVSNCNQLTEHEQVGCNGYDSIHPNGPVRRRPWKHQQPENGLQFVRPDHSCYSEHQVHLRKKAKYQIIHGGHFPTSSRNSYLKRDERSNGSYVGHFDPGTTQICVHSHVVPNKLSRTLHLENAEMGSKTLSVGDDNTWLNAMPSRTPILDTSPLLPLS